MTGAVTFHLSLHCMYECTGSKQRQTNQDRTVRYRQKHCTRSKKYVAQMEDVKVVLQPAKSASDRAELQQQAGQGCRAYSEAKIVSGH